MHSGKGHFQTPFHSQLWSPYIFEDLPDFIGAFVDVVVSHCYELGLHELQYVRLTYLKLVTDDEDDVRFVAGSRPVVSLHLLHNGFLQGGAVVRIPFRPKSPEDWIPIEGQAVLLALATIIK
jgi:hypothetical protein